MDETYVKQCDCPEIQEQWEPKEGDRVAIKGDCLIVYDLYGSVYFEVEKKPEDYADNPFYLSEYHNVFRQFEGGYEWESEKVGGLEDAIWLPRQEDWQNILFAKHYAPALPIEAKVIQFAMINMHREFVDYMEAWKIGQPCEAWARLFMNACHKKQWAEKGWV